MELKKIRVTKEKGKFYEEMMRRYDIELMCAGGQSSDGEGGD